MSDDATFDRAFARFTHLEDLVQQLDDTDIEEAINLIQALLERSGRRQAADGSARRLVPVQRRPGELDD